VAQMTFEELRIKLHGTEQIPVRQWRGAFVAYRIPELSAEVLRSIEGLQITEQRFPGSLEFRVPVAEGRAEYVGVIHGAKGLMNSRDGRLELIRDGGIRCIVGG